MYSMHLLKILKDVKQNMCHISFTETIVLRRYFCTKITATFTPSFSLQFSLLCKVLFFLYYQTTCFDNTSDHEVDKEVITIFM
jgi:hypothetical protein